MKEKKNVLRLFIPYDRKGIEEYLAAQAEAGWLIDKIGPLGFHFQKTEPRKLCFSVVYYPKGSEYEAAPSEGELTFCDFCEHAGWKTAASNRKTLVFYSESEDAVPIQTDPELERKAVTGIMIPYLLLDLLYLLLAVIHLLIFVLIQLIYPITAYENNAALLSRGCFLLVALFSIADLAAFGFWCLKAKKAIQMGEESLPAENRIPFGMISCMMTLLALGLDIFSFSGKFGEFFVYFLGTFLLVISSLLVIQFLKALKCSKRMNLILSTSFCILMSFLVMVVLILGMEEHLSLRHHKVSYEVNGQTKTRTEDPVVLTIGDLINEASNDSYNIYLNHDRSSVFLRNVRVSQTFCFDKAGKLPDPRSMNYQVVSVKAPFLYEACKAELLRDFSRNYGKPEEYDPDFEKHVKADPTPWGAKEVYQLYIYDEPRDTYILCYEKNIVLFEINFHSDGLSLTPEMKSMIAGKLTQDLK